MNRLFHLKFSESFTNLKLYDYLIINNKINEVLSNYFIVEFQ